MSLFVGRDGRAFGRDPRMRDRRRGPGRLGAPRFFRGVHGSGHARARDLGAPRAVGPTQSAVLTMHGSAAVLS